MRGRARRRRRRRGRRFRLGGVETGTGGVLRGWQAAETRRRCSRWCARRRKWDGTILALAGRGRSLRSATGREDRGILMKVHGTFNWRRYGSRLGCASDWKQGTGQIARIYDPIFRLRIMLDLPERKSVSRQIYRIVKVSRDCAAIAIQA